MSLKPSELNDPKVTELYPHISQPHVGIHADKFMWLGETTCELCGIDIAEPYTGNNFLYDARTMWGQWAVMCQECWQAEGNPNHLLGVGNGQQYLLMKDMKFHKVQG